MRQNQSFHSLRERVTFFARAKKVTKESTVCRFEGVFAEATSLCLRRTAHFLCAVEVAHGRMCQSESALISMQPPSYGIRNAPSGGEYSARRARNPDSRCIRRAAPNRFACVIAV